MLPVGNDFQTQSALAPAWHGSQDLCSAFVAAVVHVNELAARERNVLAHLHECFAPRTLRRRRFFQARPWFILGCHHARLLGPLRPSYRPASTAAGAMIAYFPL